MNNIPKHKIFISYHHKNDEYYKNKLEEILDKKYAISRSVQIGDIDPDTNTERIRQIVRQDFLSDSTVTIVLIGTETWKRKHVDWEIYSSLRDTRSFPRSGVIGLILPTRDDYYSNTYKKNTIPPRLADNIGNGCVKIYNWSTDPLFLARIIHDAHQSRELQPNLSRPLFAKNRSDYLQGWED